MTVASIDDWDVIESNASNLTAALLHQLKVVRKGDTVPIWIRGQSSVDVTVVTAQPADAVILSNDSIVSVEPPATPQANQMTPDLMSDDGLLDIASGTDPLNRDIKSKSKDSDFKLSTPALMQGPMRLRVRVSFKMHGNAQMSFLSHPYASTQYDVFMLHAKLGAYLLSRKCLADKHSANASFRGLMLRHSFFAQSHHNVQYTSACRRGVGPSLI